MTAGTTVHADPAFASDTAAGAHPDVLAAVAEANEGYAFPYGDDPWTARAVAAVRSLLDAPEARVALVYGGTGANMVALDAVGAGDGDVLCAACAHLHTDECGAPERLLRTRLRLLDHDHGRLRAATVTAALDGRARVLSLTQATELGTVYAVDELTELVVLAHEAGLLVHMDGARLANAAAALGVGPADLATRVGVDVLTLGGTKNGMLFGEAVVVLSPVLGAGLAYNRKQLTQTAPKLRFVAAQITALFGTDLWWHNARHANAAAQRLAGALAAVPGARPLAPPVCNSLFLRLPHPAIAELSKSIAFFVPDTDASGGTVRLMTSWRTTDAEIAKLCTAIERALGAAS